MSGPKKILLALLVLFLGLAGALGWAYYRQTAYSFAPEDPRQAVLAGQHADCVAYYLVLSRPSNGEKEPTTDLGKRAKTDMTKHAKFAFHLSPDKKALDVAIGLAVPRIQNEILTSGGATALERLLVEKDVACFELVLRTGAFIKEVMLRRAAVD